ncbi:RHOC [Enterospora canceri]|uniref:RHOC n=1 Tax=Enterospora canceri TaxID=1081671 RepID=A0A1Y1S7W4_9MICR|nr:RHOC [Enterospora canceri]
MATRETGKVVVVGDGACGKTCLLEVFKNDKFPKEYVPTVVDNFIKNVQVDDKAVTLALWDTAGQEDYDTIRPLSYRGTNLVVLCYTIENKKNLENINKKWLVEIKNYCPGVPFYLVGLKKDLREDEDMDPENLISKEEGQKVSEEIGAAGFYECSALTREGVDEIFVSVAKYVDENDTVPESKSACACCSCLLGG